MMSSYVKLLKVELLDLPTPKNQNYWFGLGFSLGMVYVIQILSGLILSWFYSVGGEEGGFWSVVGIMQSVWGGWMVRFTHSSGASLFMLLIYLHILRGLMYGSFKKVSVWLSGVALLFVAMGVSFMGYVLPWGSMSFWGMTVVVSMLSAVPLVGSSMVEALWGGPSAGAHSLARFFSFHYILALFVMVGVLVHLVELHRSGSSNPLGVSSGLDKVIFAGTFVVKDFLGILYVVWLYWLVVLVMPYSLMDEANFEEVNVMVTPSHIKPEWYFLFAYCILRAVPSKLGGVVLMVGSILILAGLSYFGGSSVYRVVGSGFYKVLLSVWLVDLLLLTWLGGSAAEYPYDLLGVVYTWGYFIVMWFMMLSLMVEEAEEC
uniref:Cytochrome b n=1 Tax=Longicollum sp. (in: thorny-headed worms) TaxID=3073164 RepID=A0AA49K4S3_9BILA|nr:cytochrome b [Longicollum sp. (in: thorny-headed worms)]